MKRLIENKPGFLSEKWLAAELRSANAEVRNLRAGLANEERERKLAQADLFKTRAENLRLRHRNEFLETQVENLSGVQEQLKKAVKENQKLAKELNKRNGAENPYGLGTPSSKQVKKKNSTEENQKKRGGGEKGHKGHGQKNFTEEEADRVSTLRGEAPRCGCGGDVNVVLGEPYCVYHYIPAKMEKILYKKELLACSVCGRFQEIKIPGVMPKHTYSNSAIANMLTEHYFHGRTAGSLVERWNINRGAFFNFAHNTSDKLLGVFDDIVLDLRSCLIIHADETPWKKDGAGGYAWFFGNDKIKVFIFRHTRGSVVPISILGEDELDGVLITDRYGGYVRSLKIARQYCLVHISRDVKKEERDFPDSEEVQQFAADLKPLLSDAISLRNDETNPSEYLAKAEKLRRAIMSVCNAEAKDPAVQHLQNIFREHHDKMFQWVKSPDIPADNNYAERELRPTVIARKISFGSQSERGLQTRERMMTVLHTAKCYGWDNPAEFLEKALDALAENPDADVYELMKTGNPSAADKRQP